VDQGRNVLTLNADEARARYQKIRAAFVGAAPDLDFSGALGVRRMGRELEVIANGGSAELLKRIESHHPESVTTEALTLEEIFVATLKPQEKP
jgi:hypothetical protein